MSFDALAMIAVADCAFLAARRRLGSRSARAGGRVAWGDELVGVIGGAAFQNARNAHAPLGTICFRREPRAPGRGSLRR
jgi:hypothetical protein